MACIAVLIVGSFVTPAPDWDIPITLIMGHSTYLTAPPTMRVLFERRWALLQLASFATWLSVDGLYASYWHHRDPVVLFHMRPANWPVSLALYGLCGIACLYRGSLKDMAVDVRRALVIRKAG